VSKAPPKKIPLPPPPVPRARNADLSQIAILEAARDEFAQHGLGGARVDRIAERAAVNKRLIYYYFGNKDELFLAVLEDTYLHIREAERALHLTDLPPVDAIRRLAEFTWNYYLEHPEFITLLNSENLHGATHLAQSQRIREMNSPLIETLARILERGRAEGAFRGGVDPVHLDRRARLFLPVEQAHAVDHLRPRPDDAEGTCRAAVAHHRGGPGVCPEVLRADLLDIHQLVN
jgi:AcrR family transcriptional regulator